MKLLLHNSLTGQIEPFAPQGGSVSLYVCGPTVYGLMHLGHARTYIFFDLVLRVLQRLGFQVHYIQNITDVGHLTDEADRGEDKILREALKQKRDPKEIADFFFETHREDMTALGNLPPEYHRATDYIPEIIEFIKGLLERDVAYEAGGNLYFSIEKMPRYGLFSGRKKSELLAGARVAPDPRKKNPLDFALWLGAPPGHLMSWDSPWGRGFPGWHIEDSAIILKAFGGQTIDIHGGAIELSFPHHENEIAQFEALTGKPLANWWLHTGLVLAEGEKMSKSKENFVTVKDLLGKHPKQAIRLWVFGSHYRSPMNFSEESLHQAQEGWQKIVRILFVGAQQGNGQVNLFYQEKFSEALLDNFNTPQFLSLLYEMADDPKLKPADAKATLLQFDDWLGLGMREVQTAIPASIAELLKRREEARQAGNFDFADTIRSEILEKNWQVDDTPSGPVAWPR